jgi:histidinol-phosphate aminotransferase
MQTFSKARALAGARVGMGFANEQIINLLNRIKPPYNLSDLAQKAALESIQSENIQEQTELIRKERMRLQEFFYTSELFSSVYPSDANFIFVTTPYPNEIYQFLTAQSIIIRNRNSVFEGGLRITVGTPPENDQLIAEIKKFRP